MALHIVIALPTIAIAIVGGSFRLLKALAKNNSNIFTIAFKSAKELPKVERVITLERAIKKRNKELITLIKQRRLRVITFQGAIEKN